MERHLRWRVRLGKASWAGKASSGRKRLRPGKRLQGGKASSGGRRCHPNPWKGKRSRKGKASSAGKASAGADTLLGHESVFGRESVFGGGKRLRGESGVAPSPGEESVFGKRLRPGRHSRPHPAESNYIYIYTSKPPPGNRNQWFIY